MITKSTDPDQNGSYRYRGSRPLPVFGLALTAAVGVLSMTWAAHGFVAQAQAQKQIAEPPDLRKVIAYVEVKGEKLSGVISPGPKR